MFYVYKFQLCIYLLDLHRFVIRIWHVSQSTNTKMKIWKGWDPINWFNSATVLCLFQARICMSNVICLGLFYVQWFEVRGGCTFCWYWWNCWPSLFKHSFHNWWQISKLRNHQWGCSWKFFKFFQINMLYLF
jgi:hypothetical protein